MSFGNFGVIKPSFNKLKKLLKYKKKNIVLKLIPQIIKNLKPLENWLDITLNF